MHGEEKLSMNKFYFSLFIGSFLPEQRHMIYFISLIFHGDFDAIVFILIGPHQDNLEHREGHPGVAQQEKLMFPLWTCNTCYNPIFFTANMIKIFLS